MAIILPTPDASWCEQNVTLGGLDYTITYRFNGRDKRWRFDIELGGEVVISGVKVMESQSLLGNYILSSFSHGDLYCVRFNNDSLPVGRHNLGSDRAYRIVYVTNEELETLGVS